VGLDCGGDLALCASSRLRLGFLLVIRKLAGSAALGVVHPAIRVRALENADTFLAVTAENLVDAAGILSGTKDPVFLSDAKSTKTTTLAVSQVAPRVRTVTTKVCRRATDLVER